MTNDQVLADEHAETDEPEHTVSLVHLDTSFLIKALVSGSREDRRLREWLQQGTNISMSSIGWAKFLCGPVSLEDRQRARRVVGMPLPLVEDEAVQAAELFNVGGRRRGSLPDSLIAATALKAGATLATSNPGDFRRFRPAGLALFTD